jgi:hypothetical protein
MFSGHLTPHFAKIPSTIDIPTKPFQFRTTSQLRGGRIEELEPPQPGLTTNSPVKE